MHIFDTMQKLCAYTCQCMPFMFWGRGGKEKGVSFISIIVGNVRAQAMKRVDLQDIRIYFTAHTKYTIHDKTDKNSQKAGVAGKLYMNSYTIFRGR